MIRGERMSSAKILINNKNIDTNYDYLRAMNQVIQSLAVGDATNHEDDKRKIPMAVYIVIIVLVMITLCSCCVLCFAKIFYGSFRNFWHDLRHGTRDGEASAPNHGGMLSRLGRGSVNNRTPP